MISRNRRRIEHTSIVVIKPRISSCTIFRSIAASSYLS